MMNFFGSSFCIALFPIISFAINEPCEYTFQCPSGDDICIDKKCTRCKEHKDCGDESKYICKDAKCIYCLTNGASCKNKRECCGCKGCDCTAGFCTRDKECKLDSDCPPKTVCELKPYHTKFKTCLPSCNNGGGKECLYDAIASKEYCKDGHCVRCEKEGNSCKATLDCCYGLVCSSGHCKTPPTKTPSKCKTTNERCNYAYECCGGRACKFYSKRGSVCT